MRIRIVAVGKLKEDYLKRGVDDYIKRLLRYVKITVQEVAEEDINTKPGPEVKAREAQKLESLMVAGKSNISLVIGGALGLDDSILRAADLRLSLSKLTFTHQVARFIILEQLYRSFKIIKGEPYHY